MVLCKASVMFQILVDIYGMDESSSIVVAGPNEYTRPHCFLSEHVYPSAKFVLKNQHPSVIHVAAQLASSHYAC